MAHSPRYKAHLGAAWRDLLASPDGFCAELRAAPPPARRMALAAAARALREPPELRRLPLVKGIPVELRKTARGTARR